MNSLLRAGWRRSSGRTLFRRWSCISAFFSSLSKVKLFLIYTFRLASVLGFGKVGGLEKVWSIGVSGGRIRAEYAHEQIKNGQSFKILFDLQPWSESLCLHERVDGASGDGVRLGQHLRHESNSRATLYKSQLAWESSIVIFDHKLSLFNNSLMLQTHSIETLSLYILLIQRL